MSQTSRSPQKTQQKHRKERALELLLGGASHVECAALLGVDRGTVLAWTRDPLFAGELSERRADRRQAVSAELDAACVEAVRTLRWTLSASDVPAAVRVRAAEALLDRAGIVGGVRVEVDRGIEQLPDEELWALVTSAVAGREEAEGRRDVAAALRAFEGGRT